MSPSLRARLAVWRIRLRTRAFVLRADIRLDRANRLRRAGRRREAARVVAAVRRDLRREEAWLARV